jgi:hypothetical protein
MVVSVERLQLSLGFCTEVVKHQVGFAVFDYRWVCPHSIDVLGPRD